VLVLVIAKVLWFTLFTLFIYFTILCSTTTRFSGFMGRVYCIWAGVRRYMQALANVGTNQLEPAVGLPEPLHLPALLPHATC
jgi:hypothetical protein